MAKGRSLGPGAMLAPSPRGDEGGDVDKCRNCAKPVREVEGRWFHYWWVTDPTDPLRRVMSGSRECAWIGRPSEEGHEAEPFGPSDTPSGSSVGAAH